MTDLESQGRFVMSPFVEPFANCNEEKSKILGKSSEHNDFCKNNIELQRIFITYCKDRESYVSGGECDEGDVRRTGLYYLRPNSEGILKGERRQFDITDRDGENVSLEDLRLFPGEFGIDVKSELENRENNNILMDDIKLSDGSETDCGLKFSVPINRATNEDLNRCKFEYTIMNAD